MLQWQDRFCIGVESIDEAHQELFRIINKLHRLVRMGDRNVRWTAAEAVKYVRNYTLKHFQDEEAYMRSIGFRDYEAHKAVHAAMREDVIPRLEAYLAREDYSAQSIRHPWKMAHPAYCWP
ncbi:hemerythrin domain-containing protein [Desulfovibrio sp. SGI.169]|uniref:hemerythrin domain-containing protein n=1 Tax=Desulfovibrio sp. SGI.169 TaxID=3420561 RepID=UPI003D01B856